MQYAFDELRSLVSRFGSEGPVENLVARYACALVSELAYHHVPQFEIDSKKRAMLIPCDGYQEIVAQGVSTNALTFLQTMEFEYSFVIEDRGVIIVGLQIGDILFVGFRGTRFLFDWAVNLDASLVRLETNHYHYHDDRYTYGFGVHRGFAEESLRISTRIIHEIRKQTGNSLKRFFFSGHSLGGAVAAISEQMIPYLDGPISTCIFGSPRYGDIRFYHPRHRRFVTSLIQIQRRGDIVPYVPPRSLGYADHPDQFDTDGQPILEPISNGSWPFFLWRVALFLAKRIEPHRMEAYRHELGHAAGATMADAPIAEYEKLKRRDLAHA